jgi:hypothetical protein
VSFHLHQMQLFSAIVAEVDRQMKVAGVPKKERGACARNLNTIIKAANEIVADFKEPLREAVPGMGYQAWLACDDRGLSSETLARYLTHGAVSGEVNHPHDADDFGRCYRMLRACSMDPKRVYEMSAVSTEWEQISMEWMDMERLYEAKDFKTLTDRIQHILSRIRK